MRGENSTETLAENVEDEVHRLAMGALRRYPDKGQAPLDEVGKAAMEAGSLARKIRQVRPYSSSKLPHPKHPHDSEGRSS